MNRKSKPNSPIECPSSIQTRPYEKPLVEKQTTMNFPEKIWEVINKPKFRDPSTLSPEQLTDPDYRLKQIQELNGRRFSQIHCSRCHHCR